MHTKLIHFFQKYGFIINLSILTLIVISIDFKDFYSNKNWSWLYLGFMICISIGFDLYSVFLKKEK